MTVAHTSRPPLGTIVEDTTVVPGGRWSGIIHRGNILRLIDLKGSQAVDFLCYNALDPSERYAAADTIKMGKSIFIKERSVIYSGLANPLFTVVADSCGFHDTIGGACSSELNALRYGVQDTPNCRDNFLNELAEHGLGKKDIVTNLNFFMYVPVEPDGTVEITSRSKPGDFVDLRAEMEVLAILSNCPQIYNAANAFAPTEIRVIVAEPGPCA